MPVQAEHDENFVLTMQFDHGGLIYPSKAVEELVAKVEDTFTVYFSRNELHAESLLCFLHFLQGVKLKEVGCNEHGRKLTTNIIKFYALTRLHFFSKAKNIDRNTRKEKHKLLNMRRCQ